MSVDVGASVVGHDVVVLGTLVAVVDGFFCAERGEGHFLIQFRTAGFQMNGLQAFVLLDLHPL